MAIISLSLPSNIRRRIDLWVDRHSPSSRDSILLHHRRLYILPTRFGYLFAGMLFVLFLAAINYQNSMAFVLTFMLTGLGVVSLWYTHLNLLNLDISLQAPRPVFKGEHTELMITLRHNKNSTRYAVGLQYEQQRPVYVTVPPEGSVEAVLSLPGKNRGLFKPKGITLFSRYPTGLFHAWGWLRFEVPILVYPKPASKAVLQHSLTEQFQGKAATSTVEGDDFAGLREHREGESLRHVSWKAYAQGKGLLTKTFQGHAQPSLWIDWSMMPHSSPEDRLSSLTAMVLLAENNNLKYGLKLPGVTIEQQTGLAHRKDCLTALATFRQTSPNSDFEVDDEAEQ